MAIKRSHPGNSQSSTDIALVDQPPELPLQPSPVLLHSNSNNDQLLIDIPPPHDAPQSRLSVFFAPSSPPPPDPRPLGEHFLERCSYCKRRLDHNNNIYMYNDSAFCSQECHNSRMSADKAAEDARKKAMSTSKRGMNRNSAFCSLECRNSPMPDDVAAEDAHNRAMSTSKRGTNR